MVGVVIVMWLLNSLHVVLLMLNMSVMMMCVCVVLIVLMSMVGWLVFCVVGVVCPVRDVGVYDGVLGVLWYVWL